MRASSYYRGKKIAAKTYLNFDKINPPTREPTIEAPCPITPFQKVISLRRTSWSIRNRGNIDTAPCSPENEYNCKEKAELFVQVWPKKLKFCATLAALINLTH